MNDEIKEILRNCEKAINEASGYNDTTDKIIDFITNLQQEIQKKDAYIKYLEEYNPKYYKGKKFHGIEGDDENEK